MLYMAFYPPWCLKVRNYIVTFLLTAKNTIGEKNMALIVVEWKLKLCKKKNPKKKTKKSTIFPHKFGGSSREIPTILDSLLIVYGCHI